MRVTDHKNEMLAAACHVIIPKMEQAGELPADFAELSFGTIIAKTDFLDKFSDYMERPDIRSEIKKAAKDYKLIPMRRDLARYASMVAQINQSIQE
jgi:hypothetical protein